jgi:hypothetical protein
VLIQLLLRLTFSTKVDLPRTDEALINRTLEVTFSTLMTRDILSYLDKVLRFLRFASVLMDKSEDLISNLLFTCFTFLKAIHDCFDLLLFIFAIFVMAL